MSRSLFFGESRSTATPLGGTPASNRKVAIIGSTPVVVARR